MSSPKPSESALHFLGEIGKRTELPASDADFERDRAQIVAHLKATYNEQQVYDVASFMAMDLRYMKSAISRFQKAQDQARQTMTDAISETEEWIDKSFAVVSQSIDTAFHVGVNAGGKVQRVGMAKKGGEGSATKSRAIRAFAQSTYDAGTWASTRAARDLLWPRVKAESIRLGRPMTDSRGPQTLYEWLLSHKKNTR